MKKFLALVLALIMTMSLVTISAGAEDFTDADKVTYSEAVDVMTAIGVVGGYADGSFNPTAGLTRGAAAKIICNMLLGPTTADALVANEAPFSDVAVDNVFAGYIAYCVNEGIISGYADGTFKPAAPLTGYAFMKMLLGALGYDPAIEGYTGANWSIQVAKRALNIGLDKGLEGDFSGAKALTREEACLYALNALTADMVEYENNSTVKIGEVVISNSSKAEVVEKDVAAADDYAADEDDDVVQFCEQYFKKLKKVSGDTDDFARPASHSWEYDGDEVVNVVKTADFVAVVDKAYTSSSNETLADALNKTLDITKAADKLVYADGDVMVVNGSVVSTWPGATLNLGDVVEVFVNANDKTNVEKVVVVRESAAQILEIKANTGKATVVVDGEKVVYDYNIYVDTDWNGVGEKYTELTLPGYTAEFVEDAYLNVCVKNGEVISAEIADVVTGAITKFAEGANATIDGVKYTFANATIEGYDMSVDFKNGKYDLVLDSNGYVTAVIEVEGDAPVMEDVVFATEETWVEKTTKYGKDTYTVYTQVVALDGTVSDIVIGGVKNDGTNYVDAYGVVVITDAAQAALADACTITEPSEGLYMLEDELATTTLPAHKSLDSTCDIDDHTFTTASASGLELKSTTKKLNSDYLTAETVWVQVKNSGADIKVTTATGGVNYDCDGGERIFYVYDDASGKDEVVAVVIAGSDLTSTAADMLYIENTTSTSNVDGWAQTAYDMDGNSFEITVDDASKNVSGFVTFEIDEDGVYTLTGVSEALSNKDWEDEEAYDTGLTFVESYYAQHITLTKSTNTMADIVATDLIVVDLRDLDSEKNGYDAEITSIADMITAIETLYTDSTTNYFGITCSAYVTEDGAAILFVNGTVVGASV